MFVYFSSTIRGPDKKHILNSKIPISSQQHMFYHLLELSKWYTIESRYLKVNGTIFVSPAVSRGDTKGSLLRLLSVRPSVRPSVCPSVCPYVTSHFFCPVTLFLSECNNSSSTDAIEMKLHMWIELKSVKSHAQDP